MVQPVGTVISVAATRTLACIDSTDEFEISGKIFNPYMENIQEFYGIKNLLSIMDGFYDKIGFPQAWYTFREFGEARHPAHKPAKLRSHIVMHQDHELFEICRGKIATFDITVRFRRNATWQGTVRWIEIGRDFQFRSILELIRIIDKALLNNTCQMEHFGWDI